MQSQVRNKTPCFLLSGISLSSSFEMGEPESAQFPGGDRDTRGPSDVTVGFDWGPRCWSRTFRDVTCCQDSLGVCLVHAPSPLLPLCQREDFGVAGASFKGLCLLPSLWWDSHTLFQTTLTSDSPANSTHCPVQSSPLVFC